MALNKYDKQHLRNLTGYERQVDAIYRAAVKEAAALGLSIRLNNRILQRFYQIG